MPLSRPSLEPARRTLLMLQSDNLSFISCILCLSLFFYRLNMAEMSLTVPSLRYYDHTGRIFAFFGNVHYYNDQVGGGALQSGRTGFE
jgi:hypothetical protein